MKKFLIRLDDASPTMNLERWNLMESLLDEFSIKPLMGIIPNNEDPQQKIDPFDNFFWDKVKTWREKGWEIALHGYSHCYTSNQAGILPFWNKSEFAGIGLAEQKDKIKKGIAILKKHNIKPNYFFAPSHTFDLNTLEALRTCSDIRIISDGIAIRPYKKYGFVFIPQISGHCVNFPIDGIFTFCFHPNTMKELDFINLRLFLEKHSEYFIPFSDINFANVKKEGPFNRTLAKLFFIYRKLRGLK